MLNDYTVFTDRGFPQEPVQWMADELEYWSPIRRPMRYEDALAELDPWSDDEACEAKELLEWRYKPHQPPADSFVRICRKR